MSSLKLSVLLLFLLLAAALGAPDQPPIEPMDDDFSPMLFGFFVIGICVVLFLFAVSIVAGVMVALSIGFLVAAGILSSSAFIGILRRRFSSGLRALHYQLCALASLPAGIGLLWLGSYLLCAHLHHRDIIIIGSISGICAGLLLAFAFDRLAGFAYRRFVAPAITAAPANGNISPSSFLHSP